MKHNGVLPFLVRNIDYRIPLPFSFTLQPILEACPYFSALIQFEEAGARAIVNLVAQSVAESVTEQQWILYGFVLVSVYSRDLRGRDAAIALIDNSDPERDNDMLNRLRHSVGTVNRPLGR